MSPPVDNSKDVPGGSSATAPSLSADDGASPTPEDSSLALPGIVTEASEAAQAPPSAAGAPLQAAMAAAAPAFPDATGGTGVADAERPSRWGVLRHKHFRNVWTASFVSNIGNWMEMLGVQMIVAHETGSLSIAGYLGAAQLGPTLLLGVWGGLLADRVNRRTLLVVTQAMLMLIAVALAGFSYFDLTTVPVLFGISIAQGIVLAFNMPAQQVLVPRLVPRKELTRAVTLQGIQFNASRAIGPALAGVLMHAYGATPLFVINAFTFIAVMVAVWTTPDAPAPKRTADNAITQLKAAASFLFRTRGPFFVFLATVFMSLFAAPLVRMLPLYVINVYNLSEGDADRLTGWLLAVLGLGAVLGGLALRYIPAWYPKHHFIPMALTGAGLSITLFGLTPTSGWGLVAMFVVGVFWIWGFNQSWGALQHLVDDRMRGRVMSMANVASFGVTAVGNVAAGWIGEAVERLSHNGSLGAYAAANATASGAHASIVFLSIMLLGAGVVGLMWRVPEIDGMPRNFPGGMPYRRNIAMALVAKEHWPTQNGRRP